MWALSLMAEPLRPAAWSSSAKVSTMVLTCGRRDFHVKEQSVGVFAVAEGLVGGEGGGSQQRGAAREIEDVAMPVEGC